MKRVSRTQQQVHPVISRVRLLFAGGRPCQGVIINGAIRDSVQMAKLPLGCKALGTMPCKSEKKFPGE